MYIRLMVCALSSCKLTVLLHNTTASEVAVLNTYSKALKADK
jgi:hypothetical protein